METIKKEIEVPKETSEFTDAIANVAIASKKALDDGFQLGEDLPAIATAALTHLLPAVDGATKIPGEMKENAYKFALAWAASGEMVYNALVAEKAAPAQPTA